MDQLVSLNSMATDQMSSTGHKRNQTREDGLEKIHYYDCQNKLKALLQGLGCRMDFILII